MEKKTYKLPQSILLLLEFKDMITLSPQSSLDLDGGTEENIDWNSWKK